MRLVLTVLAVWLVAATGCGSGSGSDTGSSDLDDLIAAVPGDKQVNVVDAAAVRKQLGLPSDAGFERGKRLSGDRLTLLTTLGAALPFLEDPRSDGVVDPGAVGAAAAGGLTLEDRVIAVRSSKAAGDVLDRLTTKGWKRDGDVFSRPSGNPRFAGQGKGETVLFAQSRKALDRARRGDAPGGRARELVESLDQPVRVAAAFRSGATCLSGYAAGDDVSPARGRLIVVPKEAPREDRVARKPETAGETTIDAPKIDGARVVADYTGAPELQRGLIGYRFLQNFSFGQLYRC